MTVTDVEVAIGMTGALRAFNEAGVLDISDVHVANRICALGKQSDDRVALAVALVVRALRGGSVCVDLSTIEATIGGRGVAVAAARGVARGGAREQLAQ